MFKTLRKVLMRGLVAVLPIGLTLWLLWWLGTATETLLHRFITLFVPEEHYWWGMGIIAGLLVLLIAGALVNAYVVRRALSYWEKRLEQIPVVKTLYGAIRDFVEFLPASGDKRDLRRVVAVRFGEGLVVGFVTRDDAGDMQAITDGQDLVPVYFPMSYQIGGYTIYLPRTQLIPLDMPAESAMRMVLTGGVSSGPGRR
jgi:uncharacterized membrane protein